MSKSSRFSEHPAVGLALAVPRAVVVGVAIVIIGAALSMYWAIAVCWRALTGRKDGRSV